MGAFEDFLQAASNTAAQNVSGPVDLISMLLKHVGVPVGTAVGGSEWMRQKGLTRDVPMGGARIAGETAGLLAPIAAAQYAPQIARGLMTLGENATVPRTMGLQRGAIPVKQDYQIQHTPMKESGGAARLNDLTPAFGEDIYGKNALQFFGSGDKREKEVVGILNAVRGKPDAQITIYRGVPKEASSINAGDWVTLSRSAAQDYASQHPGGKVLAMKVPASHITSWADSLLEFGYYPP